MSEYPKMLYKGNQEKYQTIIANDEDHESELIERSWCEYGELPEQSIGNDPIAEAKPNSFFNKERFELATQELVETKQALVVANEEIERLNQIIETGSAENADLREQLTFFQNEGPKLTASAGDQLAKTPVDYSNLIIGELQALLDEKGIKYLKNDNKATLLALLG